MKLVVASNNPGKLREFGALLAPLGWETVAQKELGVPECEEPHHTFVENALEKARHAARCTGLPAMADDSGLCVHALGGAPGVYSARYAGEPKSDARNNAKVIAPRPVSDRENNWLASVTTEGRLLIFKISDLPQLGKGKGNKIIGIPGERVASREEYVTDIAVLPQGATLVLQAGKRTLSLKADDLEHYKGERGRRGNKLPRGFQRVDALLVEVPN